MENEATGVQVAIYKYIADELGILNKAIYPGKLKNENYCIPWYQILINYLLTIIGDGGVPLSYVIREKLGPTYNREE